MDRGGAHREWAVSADLVDRVPGSGLVRIRLNNGMAGAIPEFTLQVDWKPGMEPVDVEALALGILADGAHALGEKAITIAAEKVRQSG